MRKPKDLNRKDLRVLGGDGAVEISTKDGIYCWASAYIDKKDLMRVAFQLVKWALYFTPPDYKEKK